MSWNYRPVRKDEYIGLHETYYNRQHQVHSMTEDCVKLGCYESVDSLIDDLERMLKDTRRFKNDVLDHDMKFAEPDEEYIQHDHSEN